MPFHRLLPSSFNPPRRPTPAAAQGRPARTEPLEARCLMHGGHDHVGGGAALHPAAGSVFVDVGNVTVPFTDSAGATTWAPDAGFTGGKRLRGRFPVAGTEDDGLFTTRRQGKTLAYAVPATDGDYTLSLLFVDTVKKPGRRMFHVDAEGRRLESDLDVVARAGARRTALVVTHAVTVTGGTLDLSLTRVKGQAVLSAFSLVPVAGEVVPPPGPTTPAAPTNLAAAAQSPTAIALSWSDNSGDETGFEVERSADGGATFAPLLTLPAGATGYVDAAGLEPGRAYQYRVRAVSDLGGASPWSVAAAATTPPDVVPPPPPAVPAAPSNLAAQAAGPTSIVLSWSDNAADETGFVIERSTNGSAFAALVTLPADSTAHRDDTAAAGTAYAYRVRAANAAGQSAASNEASATTPGAGAAPAAPSNLTATVAGGTEVRLSWSDNSADETGFVIERATDGGPFAAVATPAAGATQHTDSAVSPGDTYAYRVRATNGAGASGPSAPTLPITIPSPPPGGTATAPTGLTATAATASTLDLSWTAPADDAEGEVTAYRISYAPGEYDPGPAGQWQVVEVPGTATSVQLSGLLSFALYSIDVAPVRASGVGAAAHVNARTAKPAGMSRYLYLVDAPKDKPGFEQLKPQIEVFDIENGHRWVKNIPLPSGIYNIRGVAASVETGRLYVSYFLTGTGGYQPGGLLCLDINTSRVLWRKDYPASVVPSPDRFDITPDGKKIYMPVGEHGPDRFWVVIDAANGNALGRIYHTTAPHNTIVSLDGRYAFLEGQEKGTQPADVLHTIGVVDTATDQVVRKIGPFREVVRPFTINGSTTLAFATVNDFIGFQVGDVRTGKVIFTVPVPGATQPAEDFNRVVCHGISLSPDEREIWLVDTLRVGIHVFDVSGVRSGRAPTYIKFIQTRKPGRDLSGNYDPNASRDARGVPAWLNRSHDGKYVYGELGEIIDAATKRVVGQLRAKELNASGQLVDAPYSHSRFMLEVDVVGGRVVRATDQFGVGLVR